MMLYYIEKSKKTVKCPKCDELLKFNIDLNNLTIIGQCKKGHYFNDINFDKFENDYIKITDVCKIKNGELKPGENELNYTCHKCKKSILCTCNENNNKNDILCPIHDLKYDYCYNNSKIFLCKDCMKLYEYDGEDKEKELKMKINDYIEKNTNLINYLDKIAEEFEERHNKLCKYLKFLSHLNNSLLKNFNFTILDDYNYDNFNYLLNHQKNDEILNEKNFFNYVVYGSFLNNNKINEINIVNNNSDIINQKEKYEKKENIINNYNNLKYFKDNIFYFHYDMDINLFEYTNFSFKHLCSFKMDKQYNKFESLIKSNYDHFFYMFNNDDYLYMLDYSAENKNLYIKHKINLGKYYRFKNLIETEKGHIIIKEKKSFTIWQKNNNTDDDKYKLVLEIEGRFDILYNINDSLFLSVQDNNNKGSTTKIYFYEIGEFNVIKKMNLPLSIKSIHKLNNETLVFIYFKMSTFFFYDIKNLELVQVMEYKPIINSYLLSNDNFLFEFVVNEDKGEVRVRKLNVKNVCFESYGIMKTKINQDIFLTNNNFVFFTQNNGLTIFKL